MPPLSVFDREELAALLASQHGIIARRQTQKCAMTPKALRHRTRPGGPWQVILPGVYASQPGRLSDQARAVAALLYARQPMAITGPAAMAFHGACKDAGEMVDVLVPLESRQRDCGFVRLRRTSIEPGAFFREGMLTYVPLDRAIADTARALTDMTQVRALVSASVQRGSVAIWQLQRELAAGPRQGSARLRAVLAEVADGVRSVAEADLRLIIRQFRLPAPLYNPALFTCGRFLARPDAWWPEYGVAVEVDSKAWHLSPTDWERTLQRDAAMTEQGILVLHFTPAALRAKRRQVAGQIKATLSVSRGPLPHIGTRPAG